MSLVVRSLILDLDGTLIDSRPGILESFGAAVVAVFPGREFDLSTVSLGPPIRRMFEVSFPAASEAEIDGLLGVFRRHYDRGGFLKARLYEGAREVLAHFKNQGIGVNIATNKPLQISTAILANLGVGHYFRSIVAADSVQPPFASKVEMVRHLMESGRLKPAETWLVGDSVEDAAAAAECGLPFVWAAYGYGRLGRAERKSAFRTIRTLGVLTQLLP
jgi:phosphoglycolate phosphatase